MPIERWTRRETIDMSRLPSVIKQSLPDLLRVTKPALGRAVARGEQLIKSRTPVVTGRLLNSWETVETKDGYVTGNDAQDPETGYHYSAHVEADPRRRAGPAYMIYGALDQIVSMIHEEMLKVN